jgi:hypothetical protein
MIPVSVFGYQAMMIKPQPIYEVTQDGVHYSAYVSVTWRHADGTIYATSYQHNLLTDLGKNLIKTLLSSDATGATLVKYIQITNATFTAGAGSTYCCGTAHVVPEDHYGLAPAAGTYASTGTGTWTITHVFIYDGTAGTQTIYGAALTTSVTTGAAAANDFAEALFSTTAPLSANGDNVQKLVSQEQAVQVQWSLSVS